MKLINILFKEWFKLGNVKILPAHRAPLEQRRMEDLSKRIVPAIVVYPALWFVMGIGMMMTTPSAHKLHWILSIQGILVTATVLRLYFCALQRKQFATPEKANYLYTDLGVILSALSWSVVLVSGLTTTPLNDHFPLIITATMGLAAGGMVNLSIRIKTVLLFLICLFSPSVIALLTPWAAETSGLSLLFLFFLGAIFALSVLPRREYELAVVNELKLSDQAAYLRDLSNRDPLTGLCNRRYFEETLNQEYHRATRLNCPLSVIIIDIDHFKKINDEFGHPVGDLCLKHVANTLEQKPLRLNDTLARIGGEEFSIILLDVDAHTAYDLAQEIRRKVEASTFSPNNTPLPITISLGGATYDPDNLIGIDELLRSADDALYRSKRQGRNKVSWSHRPVLANQKKA